MKHTKTKKKNVNKGYKRNIVTILAAIFFLFPWITYLKIVEYDKAESLVFSNYQGRMVDFFLQYKAWFVLVIAIFVIAWFIGERILPDKVDNDVPLLKGNNRVLFILAGVFVVSVVFTTIFSEHKKTALYGSPTEGEGLFTLVGYAVIILAFYNYFASTDAIATMRKAIWGTGAITVVLSLVEYFYKPLLEIKWIQMLVCPAEYAKLMASVGTSATNGAVSLTFYNSNYYGGFICILIPFVLVFYLQADKWWKKVLDGILSAGLLFCVLASNATTALYIAIIEYVIVFVLYGLKEPLRKGLLKSGSILLAGVVAVIVLFGVVDGSGILAILLNANSSTGNVVEDRFEIADITLTDDKVSLIGKEDTLTVAYDDGQIYFYDKKNNVIDAEYKEGIVTFADARYEDLKVEMTSNSESDSQIVAKIEVDAGYDDTIDFFVLSDGTLAGVGQSNTPIKDIGGKEVPEGLERFYGMFTGRGYAWVNSLPILGQSFIKGVGPGNFAFYFKQQDYVGMLQTHGSVHYVIDKPHNAYLQYAINLGICGMVAFFGMFVLALLRGVKTYCRKESTQQMDTPFLIAGMVCIVGFLIYSIINDSMVTVTPVICMVAGIVLAVSYRLTGGRKDG